MTETPPTTAGTDVLGIDGSLPGRRAGDECGVDDDAQCNGHAALVYESRAEQLAAVAAFLERGLERGERCMYVLDENDERDVVAALRGRGVDVAAARDAGDLTFHTVAETYLRGGEFDREAMATFYADLVDEATAEYAGLRASAETAWLQDDPDLLGEFLAFEAEMNHVYDDAELVGLCQYARDGFGADVLRDVIRTHPRVVVDGTACGNVFYRPPERYFEGDADDELGRMLSTLRETATTRRRRRERTRDVRELYEIAADADRAFDARLQDLFELGRRRFGAELGGVARIDPAADAFAVEATSDEHPQLRPGIEVALSETYCRLVADGEPTAGVTDPEARGFVGTRAYEEFGVRSYLGTRIELDGARDRTLFFVTTEPRSEPFSAADRTFLDLMGQWLRYELQRRDGRRRLRALNRLSRELMDCRTCEEVGERVVAAAGDDLGLPVTAIARYDGGAGRLRPAAATDAGEALLERADLLAPDGLAWRAFVEHESQHVADGVALDDGDVSEVSAVLTVPLGDYGVLVAGATAAGGYCAAEREFVETVSATVAAAIDRAERERQLGEREATLAERNQALAELDRINTTIRRVDQALISASTREAVQRVACRELAAEGHYEFAWIGEYDRAAEGMRVAASAGGDADAVEALAAVDAGDASTDPSALAARTGEPQIVSDMLADRSEATWRQAALTRGYHSLIALPLVYEGTCYGVLHVYADTPDAFDESTVAVLSELSDTVAYAINAVESKKALVSDEVTELEFAVGDDRLAVVDLTAALDCQCALQQIVPRQDGGLRAFFIVRGAAADAVTAYAPQLPIADYTLVASYEDDGEPVSLFEVTMDEHSLLRTALEHGGRVTGLAGEYGEGTVTVELAADAPVREFARMFAERYPDSELVAQRTHVRESQTEPAFRTELVEVLTDRQLEAVQTAYYSGYFDKPRTMTGSEVAETMGITQPTFNTHLRAATRKLCRQLFDGVTVSDRP